MARTLAELPKGARITDYMILGVLTKAFPRARIDAVLAATKTASRRPAGAAGPRRGLLRHRT